VPLRGPIASESTRNRRAGKENDAMHQEQIYGVEGSHTARAAWRGATKKSNFEESKEGLNAYREKNHLLTGRGSHPRHLLKKRGGSDSGEQGFFTLKEHNQNLLG